MSRHLLSTSLALLVSMPPCLARAADTTKQACVDANDAAQDLRQSGKLRQAREKLAICASASCPSVVRDDCTQRLAELDSAMPQIVFSARDASGNDLVDVKVTIDGAPLVDRLDGSSVKVDPGPHVFVFTWEGHPVVTKRLVLAEHDHARREVVVFRAVETPQVESASPAPAATGSGGIDRKTIAFAVGGAGVAGLVVGSIFGAVASSKWSAAKSDCGAGCAPTASAQGEKNTASSDAAISTVAFVVGGALAAGGVVLYLTAPSGSSPGTGMQLAPSIGAGSGGLLVRGSF